ncbi:MAG: iron-sulfur cluster co-chaperone HscB C-terminal domain-containing protein [Planctomycetota bacterium]
MIQTDGALDPFTILGLEDSMEVDPADLKKRLRRFTRLVHPDFYALEGTENLALAEENNALLNEAYDILSDDIRRADWLVRHLGGPSEKDLGGMPQEFLMEVMEWNEVLEEAEAGSQALRTLEDELCAHRDRVTREIRTSLTPLPEHGAPALESTRKNINAYRYIDRAMQRIAGIPYTL